MLFGMFSTMHGAATYLRIDQFIYSFISSFTYLFFYKFINFFLFYSINSPRYFLVDQNVFDSLYNLICYYKQHPLKSSTFQQVPMHFNHNFNVWHLFKVNGVIVSYLFVVRGFLKIFCH